MNSPLKVVILGGSALATPLLFQEMGRRAPQQAYHFVLHGRDQERLSLVKKAADALIASFPDLNITTAVETNLEKALEGADYCINQIRVGGLEGRAFDETFPRQFGIPGEETVGPGGFNNALRGIPVVLDICRTIEKVAPHLLMFNLTNPSSIIQYAIRRYTSVQVVGTCDSPVSLMQAIAGLLSAPLEDLRFALSGMHHFGWISGIQQGGQERIAEVLARVHELPKLGVDPELVQSLQVIPSFYHKYYFHPDRILAETEGRTVRAHQLMQLSEQILADLRRWQPGAPLDMLTRRGAVWYEKIVVPALLAFSEKRDAELVLSVDNRDNLPWLPEDAIVELPVVIQAGRIVSARPASLPRLPQVMTQQNAAYEILAAQAIVERDRSKALQALLANLLVASFNQARGILDTIWPQADARRFEILVAASKDEQTPPLKVPRLHFGPALVEAYDPPEDDFALITMRELWPLVEGRLSRKPEAIAFVTGLDWYALEALERQLPPVSAVVGLGGGVAQDAAKYIAWRRRIPVDEIVSITSVDASVTKSVAARAAGHVTYIGHIVPRRVYVDERLIQSAPPRLNRSGVGDILCAHVALWDWSLAHERTGEPYDPQAAAAVRSWLEQVVYHADDIRQVNPTGIRTVMDAFADISIICRRFGSSRPQEASEHTFAYNAEFQTGKTFLHGELVALGAWIMANFQDNQPQFLEDAFARIGICWQPKDLSLTRADLTTILSTLNWYQSNFGRRFSILNVKKITPDFIRSIIAQLEFPS